MTDAGPTVAKAKDGRGGFFAVDRRAWHLVTGLGMNPAVAYLVMARGTGGDNRSTKWSTNAIEKHTGIARSRCKLAVEALEKAGAVWRDPAGKRDHPRYKLVPAHEIVGCEGYVPPFPTDEHRAVHAALGHEWMNVPTWVGGAKSKAARQWGSAEPWRAAQALVSLGLAEQRSTGTAFKAVHHDVEVAARPDWIWLPNTLVDGATDEVPPVELARQTDSLPTLRLLVNVYGSHSLDEDGGINSRRIRQTYERHKVGEQGPYTVWGFASAHMTAWPSAPFVAVHLQGAKDEAGRKSGWDEFWTCWRRLEGLGLVQFVGHLMTSDGPTGEMLHPMALPGTGLPIEVALAEAATEAGVALVTERQASFAFMHKNVEVLAPVKRHIENVQMVGVARLRYRPRTSRTLAFFAREAEWTEALDQLRSIAAGQPEAPSRAPCNIKEGSR